MSNQMEGKDKVKNGQENGEKIPQTRPHTRL